MKPGYLTTEFWGHFVVTLGSLLTGLGAIGPSLPARYASWVHIAGLIVAAITTANYTNRRTALKVADIATTPSTVVNYATSTGTTPSFGASTPTAVFPSIGVTPVTTVGGMGGTGSTNVPMTPEPPPY